MGDRDDDQDDEAAGNSDRASIVLQG